MDTLPVILAAGTGQRFAPFVTPKPLVVFMGQPLLKRIITQLQSVGFTHCVIVVNQGIQSAINQLNLPGMTIKTLIQPQNDGMAGALLAAASTIGSRPILVMNAATFVTASLYDALMPTIASKTDSFVAKAYVTYFPGGYVQYQGDRAVAIIEKPDPQNTPSNDVVLVHYHFVHPQDLFSALGSTHSPADDVFERAVTKYLTNHPAQVVRYSGPHESLKYPHHLLTLSQSLLQSKAHHHESQNLYPSMYISDNVTLGKNVTLHPGCVIKGPTYLGDNVVVGDHAIIRQSMVEADSVIGSHSEVIRSYIGPQCHLHGAYCGDSVLESHVHLSYGSICANVRLDHQNIRYQNAQGDTIAAHTPHLGSLIASGVEVGIHASLMPGTVVGSKAVIGPQALVKGFVPAGKVVYNT